MVKFKIPLADILGSAYYQYELTSSSYNPNIDSTITITCTLKSIRGNPVSNKTLTLYQNGTNQGTSTTNANGIATWSITLSDWGLQDFRVGNQILSLNVTGMKVIAVNDNFSIWYNGDSRVVMGRYSNNSVTTTNTQETVIANGVIPSQYRPVSDVKVPFNQSGSIIFFKTNGNISIRTSSTGTHNVNTIGTWII